MGFCCFKNLVKNQFLYGKQSFDYYIKKSIFKIKKIIYLFNMNTFKKINIQITQNKFYIIAILLLLFISLQLDGINDKLNTLIELYR